MQTNNSFDAAETVVHPNAVDEYPTYRWNGTALGRQVSLTLCGPALQVEAAINEAIQTLSTFERLFSLNKDNSLLRRLNRDKRLDDPPALFLDLLHLVTRVHIATRGVFDPSVQPICLALSRQDNIATARRQVGWKHVDVSEHCVVLGAEQQLNFDGIAPGFATDLLIRQLRQLGLKRGLVNIGEFAAIGGSFRLGITAPEMGLIETLQLRDQALASSQPQARHFGRHSHILNPVSMCGPHWATAAVLASSAALADAAATAFAVMRRRQIRIACRTLPELSRVYLVGGDGRLISL